MKSRSDRPFQFLLVTFAAGYLLLLLALFLANARYLSVADFPVLLRDPNLRYAVWLSLTTSLISTILALWVAIPVGYLLSRSQFRGKALVEAILDLPLVVPPLVIGLSLLILFRQTALKSLDDAFPIAFEIPAVILAQFVISTAFAIRTLRVSFAELSPRTEDVALTLGCSRSQAFWAVALPGVRQGLLSAATLAWARAFGQFGPILVFAGATRRKTEVLPVSIHLELATGNIESAVAVSLFMILTAIAVLISVRVLAGWRRPLV